MSGPKVGKRTERRSLAPMSEKQLQAIVKAGGKSGEKARKELVKRKLAVPEKVV